MRLFLDTSTLFKLYQKEAGTEEIIGIITNNNISKYNLEGLRTLDSIQMSTAISIPEKVDLCKSSDKKLIKIFELEGLNTIVKKT